MNSIPQARARAFTLVELLVVIGIIALLISILLPALNKAREQSNQVKCLSNLRQIGTAAQMFANEHQQRVPIAGVQWGTGVDGTPGGFQDSRERYYTYFFDGATKRVMPLPCALALYLGQTRLRDDSRQNMTDDFNNGYVRRVFACPSQADNVPLMDIIDAGSWVGPAVYCSYGWNQEALGWGKPGDGSGIINHTRARGQLNRMGRFPADTMFMCDGKPRAGTQPGIGGFYTRPADFSLQDSFNMNNSGDVSQFDLVRHGGKINILFMDFHAEKFDISPNSKAASLKAVYMDHGFAPG